MTTDKLFLKCLPLFFLAAIIGSVFVIFDPTQTVFTKIFVPVFVLAMTFIFLYNLRKDYEALFYPHEYHIRIWDGIGWHREQIRGKSLDNAIKRYKKRGLNESCHFIELIREL